LKNLTVPVIMIVSLSRKQETHPQTRGWSW